MGQLIVFVVCVDLMWCVFVVVLLVVFVVFCLVMVKLLVLWIGCMDYMFVFVDIEE